ncbi:EamA family transporter, partial [Candidatus Roizmanbacteria bacterium]|nr:EamA family transporter [Candidatus Roizmanbacteria bacterium]
VIIISWKRQKIRFQKGELFAILAAFLLAGSTLNDAHIVKAFNVPSYLTLQYLITSMFLWVVYHKKTEKIKTLVQSKTIHKIALLAIAYGTASITYLSAYKLGNNAAQIGTIFQVSSILTVLLAIIILKEKSGIPMKIVAAVLSFIGVLLVK